MRIKSGAGVRQIDVAKTSLPRHKKANKIVEQRVIRRHCHLKSAKFTFFLLFFLNPSDLFQTVLFLRAQNLCSSVFKLDLPQCRSRGSGMGCLGLLVVKQALLSCFGLKLHANNWTFSLSISSPMSWCRDPFLFPFLLQQTFTLTISASFICHRVVLKRHGCIHFCCCHACAHRLSFLSEMSFPN